MARETTTETQSTAKRLEPTWRSALERSSLEVLVGIELRPSESESEGRLTLGARHGYLPRLSRLHLLPDVQVEVGDASGRAAQR